MRTNKDDGDAHADRLLHDLTLKGYKYGIELLPEDPLQSEKLSDIEMVKYLATNAKAFKRK